MAAPLEEFDDYFGELAALLHPEEPEPATAPRPAAKWKRRPPNLLAFARECKAKQALEERLEACQESEEACDADRKIFLIPPLAPPCFQNTVRRQVCDSMKSSISTSVAKGTRPAIGLPHS